MDKEEEKIIKAQADRVSYLIVGYLKNSLSPEEDEELSKWITQNEQNWKIFEEFTGESFKKKIF